MPQFGFFEVGIFELAIILAMVLVQASLLVLLVYLFTRKQ